MSKNNRNNEQAFYDSFNRQKVKKKKFHVAKEKEVDPEFDKYEEYEHKFTKLNP